MLGPCPPLEDTGSQGPEPTQAAWRAEVAFGGRSGGPLPTSLPPPTARQHRVRPQQAPQLPASAATFRGARPAEPPQASVTRWGVSAVTAAWPPARASRASRAARAPHPQACGETGRSRTRFRPRLSWRPRQGGGGGGGARPSENPSEPQPPRSGGPEVARAANSGVDGGQSQGQGLGVPVLLMGDGTAVGEWGGRESGEHPRVGGWGSTPGVGGAACTPPWPYGQHLGLLFHLSISLQGWPLSLPAMAGGVGGGVSPMVTWG